MVAALAGGTVVNGSSIAAAFLNHNICAGQNAVAEILLAQRGEIRPIAGLWRRSVGNDTGDDHVALPEFHRLAGTQPGLQPLCVSELANVDTWHCRIVPHFVAHCQRAGLEIVILMDPSITIVFYSGVILIFL